MAGGFREFAARYGVEPGNTQNAQGGSVFQNFKRRLDNLEAKAQITDAQDLWDKIQRLPQTNNSSELRELVNKEGARFGSDFQKNAIEAIDQYETQYPGNVFDTSIKQYIPGDLEDWRGLTKEYAEQKIKEYENRISQEEQRREAKYHYYTEEELDKMTPAEQLAALNSEGIKGVPEEEFNADNQIIKSLRDELEKYKKYDTILSLQKETKAYENLTDEDKRLVSQMAQIEAAGKKLKYEEERRGGASGPSGDEYDKESGRKAAKGNAPYGYTDWKQYEALAEQLKNKGVWSQDLQDYITRVGNYLQTGIKVDEWEQYTKDHKILSNIASILMKPGAAVQTAVGAIGTNIGNAVSGESKPIDVYAPENRGSNIVDAIRGTSSEMILGDNPNTWQKFLDKGYQLFMSTGDSALTIPMSFIPGVGPALAAGTMGVEAGADTALDASRRGGSAGQALTAGILAGAAETLFEKYSIGELIDTAKTSSKSFKALMKSIGINAGVNAQEEAATEIANIISDTLVMQDLSQYNLTVEQYMKDGLSRAEAEKKANLGLIGQVVEAGIGGAAQGIFMGGVGSTIGYIRSASDTRAVGSAVKRQAGGVDALLDTAAQHPNNAAIQAAVKAVQKKDSDSNVGNLAYQLQQQTGKPVGNIIYAPAVNAANNAIDSVSKGLESADNDAGAAANMQNASAFQEIDLNEGPDDYIQSLANITLGQETTEGRRKVQSIGRKLGLNVVFDLYGDPAQIGEAYIQGDTIHINTKATRPVFQLFKHELAHFAERSSQYNDFANTIMDSQAFRNWVQSKGYDSVAAYNTDVVERYRSALKDSKFGEHEANLEMLADYVAETLYQGDTAGMSALLASLEEKPRRSLIQWIKDFIQHIKEKLQRSTQKNAVELLEQQFSKVLLDAQKNTAQKDGEAKYSIKYDAENRPFVEIERDILNGVPRPEWINTVKRILANKFPDGVRVGNNTIKINSQSRREMVYSEYTKWLARNDKSTFADKFRAADYADEIILASRDYINEGLKHARQDNIRDFARGTVMLRVGGKDYTADVVVGTTRNGDMLLYDIVNLQHTTIKEKSRHTVQPNQTEGRRSGTPAIDSITPENTGVNSQSMQKDRKYSVPMNPAQIADLTEEDANTTPNIRRKQGKPCGNHVSQFYESIQASDIFDDAFKRQAIDDQFLQVYDGITNKETLQAAKKALDRGGSSYVEAWKAKKPTQMNPKDVAVGVILMDRYQRVGNYEGQIAVAEKLREIGTNAGQTVQMFSILGRFTPEAMTYYAQKSLSNAFDTMVKGKTQKWIDANKDRFQLSGEDIEFIRRRTLQAAHLPEGRDKHIRLAEVAARIQDKIPPEKGQGIKAIQRISMLLNLKTNIRNVMGNAIMVPTYWLSDTIGTAVDKVVAKKTDVRTTGLFQFGAGTANAFKEGIFNSWDDFVRHINTREITADRWDIGQGNSFNEHHTGRLAKVRNALSKDLNATDRFGSFLLEAGDRSFYQMWFINSLNNQMRLNNVSEPTAHMIEIATQEALQRTWQDNNVFTRAVKKIKEALNVVKIPKTGYGLGDVFIKFVKTPANLTKAIVDFSPAGMVKAIAGDGLALKNAIQTGQYTPALQKAFVDSLSKGITGTILYAIFYGLASAGILVGDGDEDKDANAFNRYIRGVQPYSVKIGDHTFSYEWAQPIGAMMAIMADYMQAKNPEDDSKEFNAIKEALQAGGQVLFNQSFMQSIQNLFKDDNIMQNILDGLLDEPAVFVPQIVSQTASAFDSKARNTYEYGKPLQTAINKVKYKIPVVRNTLPTDIDVLGRERKNPQHDFFNAYLNPANTYAAETTPAADEIYRLYQQTGEKSVFPQKAPNYINYKGEKHVLTTDQKTEYQEIIGMAVERFFTDLAKDAQYKKMADEDKVDVVQKLYSYANAKAKESVLKDYEMSSNNATVKMLEDAGVSAADQMLIKATADTDGNGSISDKEYKNAVWESTLEEWTKQLLIQMRKAQRTKNEDLRKEKMKNVVEKYGR